MAVATGTLVSGARNTAIGAGAASVMRGAGSVVTGLRNVAMGTGDGTVMYDATLKASAGNSVSGNDNIAIGTNAGIGVTANATTSIGYNAQANGLNAIALGAGAQATGANSISISIGTGTVVSGANSGAFSDPSTITGTGSYSVGNNNTINANNAFVVGGNQCGYSIIVVELQGNLFPQLLRQVSCNAGIRDFGLGVALRMGRWSDSQHLCGGRSAQSLQITTVQHPAFARSIVSNFEPCRVLRYVDAHSIASDVQRLPRLGLKAMIP